MGFFCLSGKPNIATTSDVSAGHRTPRSVKGTVVLVKHNLLGFQDVKASFLDTIYVLLGQHVSIQLISSARSEHPGDGSKRKPGKLSHLKRWISTVPSIPAADCQFSVTFEWDKEDGVPGAFIIKNHHYSQFYLRTVTLEDVPEVGRVHFVCNSWIYPSHRYQYDRIFFSNKAYLPCQTPEPLVKYREQELVNLRGNGAGKLKEWDRVYDYAFYNDLGDPDQGPEHARPVLGGSLEYPYPRRGRTGRKPTKSDPNSESRLPFLSLNIYVPRDEHFHYLKLSDFLADGVRSILQVLVRDIPSLIDPNLDEFESFEDVFELYEGGIKLSSLSVVKKLRKCIPWEFLKELIPKDGETFLKFPMPEVIKEDKFAWGTDDEFCREMLAGVNPVLITCLRVFPPSSNLDSNLYGNQNSIITREQLEGSMNGLTVDQAITSNRLFILDHHDTLIPFLRRINSTSTKTYASRTILLLQNDSTLKPLAIELSLPHPQGDTHGAISKVYTPAENGVHGSVWQLAKAYAAVNDSGYHQLVSHWLNTHAVMEPFIIATNRQLSVCHPIHKLLYPHFRDNMQINALGRQIVINSGGIIEKTVFPTKYAMEMSSAIYKNCVFTDQALPADLLKRGVAVPDSSQPHSLRLLIEDYPYAVDGLEIWSAIKTWVEDYCVFYYPEENLIENDHELQSWWDELRNIGHGDKKHEAWWPNMNTFTDLTQTCTTIIWIASALHAAVNFGQYPYAGFLPNRPTASRRFMPEPGTSEYDELKSNPESVFLKTITAKTPTLLGLSLIELLSRYSTEEVYLGQRDTPEWTSDQEPLEAFERFGNKLREIEKRILESNSDTRWKNRVGAVNIPYTLLFPNTSDLSPEGGITGKGIPNSVSI